MLWYVQETSSFVLKKKTLMEDFPAMINLTKHWDSFHNYEILTPSLLCHFSMIMGITLLNNTFLKSIISLRSCGSFVSQLPVYELLL